MHRLRNADVGPLIAQNPLSGLFLVAEVHGMNVVLLKNL